MVKLRCGENYKFHIVKSVTDLGNGTVEIIGNFKPRGKYHDVVVFIMSIENWKEILDSESVGLRPYYCSKCKRIHKSGEIFTSHKAYYADKEEAIPNDKILEADTSNLRSYSKSQLERLLKRMKWNPEKTKMYTREINKLLIYEGVVTDDEFLDNYTIR